ncbi:MAG: ion transporter [Pseudomonadota bacterium]
MSLQARFQAIQSSKAFETFIIVVIMASALLVGVKTYSVPDWVMTSVTVLDFFITIIFVVEISIRFAAHHPRRTFFKDPWNLFDTLIVVISLIPIDNSDTALVARLVRVFRVLRMISIIPELRMLLNSLLKALPRLGYVMALMFIIFYIYAAAGSLVFEDINPELWGDIAISMLTLFRVMTFEDWTDVMYETMAVYPLSWIFYLSFIFLTAFAFLNMIIGIVVNVLEEEHAAANAALNPITNEQLYAEIQSLKQLIAEQNLSSRQ